jgi:uncharacterized membrane protein YeaQ/YmgE (transglycosylase-associated protein family)
MWFFWLLLGFLLGLLACWLKHRKKKPGRMAPLSNPSTRK